jgi:hypothetical protein
MQLYRRRVVHFTLNHEKDHSQVWASRAVPACSSDLSARIAQLEAGLAVLRRQHAEGLVVPTAAVISPDVAFSAREPWRHHAVSPELREALRALHVNTARTLVQAQ